MYMLVECLNVLTTYIQFEHTYTVYTYIIIIVIVHSIGSKFVVIMVTLRSKKNQICHYWPHLCMGISSLMMFRQTKMESLFYTLHMHIRYCVVYVHTQDDDFATSPLGKVCENNQLQIVKVLIENVAMVNYRDKVCFNSITNHAWLLYLYTLIGWMDRPTPCNTIRPWRNCWVFTSFQCRHWSAKQGEVSSCIILCCIHVHV